MRGGGGRCRKRGCGPDRRTQRRGTRSNAGFTVIVTRPGAGEVARVGPESDPDHFVPGGAGTPRRRRFPGRRRRNRALAFEAGGTARVRRGTQRDGGPEVRSGAEDRAPPAASAGRGDDPAPVRRRCRSDEDPTGTTPLRGARSRRGGPDAGATAQEPRFGVRGGRQRPCSAGSANRGRAGSAFRSGRTGRLPGRPRPQSRGNGIPPRSRSGPPSRGAPPVAVETGRCAGRFRCPVSPR